MVHGKKKKKERLKGVFSMRWYYGLKMLWKPNQYSYLEEKGKTDSMKLDLAASKFTWKITLHKIKSHGNETFFE